MFASLHNRKAVMDKKSYEKFQWIYPTNYTGMLYGLFRNSLRVYNFIYILHNGSKPIRTAFVGS